MAYAGEIARILERTLQLLAQEDAFDKDLLARLRTLYASGKLADDERIRTALGLKPRAEEA